MLPRLWTLCVPLELTLAMMVTDHIQMQRDGVIWYHQTQMMLYISMMYVQSIYHDTCITMNCWLWLRVDHTCRILLCKLYIIFNNCVISWNLLRMQMAPMKELFTTFGSLMTLLEYVVVCFYVSGIQSQCQCYHHLVSDIVTVPLLRPSCQWYSHSVNATIILSVVLSQCQCYHHLDSVTIIMSVLQSSCQCYHHHDSVTIIMSVLQSSWQCYHHNVSVTIIMTVLPSSC